MSDDMMVDDDYPDVMKATPIQQGFRRSAQFGELVKALAGATLEFGEVKKDADNPYFNSKYSDLSTLISATRSQLAKHGLVVVQFPKTRETGTAKAKIKVNNQEQLIDVPAGVVVVSSALLHTSNQWLEEDLEFRPKVFDPQGCGSAITYARRYAYQSILNLAGDLDDDGNAASGKIEQAEERFLAKMNQGKAAPNLVLAFNAMFKASGKTEAQLATILRTRYSADAPSDLSKDELGELVKWVASKEPLQQTLESSVKAVNSQSRTPQAAHLGGRSEIADPESQKPYERILCRPAQIVDKKTTKGVSYMILECFTDKGNIDVFVWDKKIQAELADVKGRPCIFRIERKPKGISLIGIEEIDGIKFGEDGLPVLDVNVR
jgi:hypothetical protein